MVSTPRQKKIVYGVTVGASAYSLLRGQLRWLSDQGWEVILSTTPDEQATQSAIREGVALDGIAMTRRMSPVADLKALWGWIRLLRKHRPMVVNASTPKAGLLGCMAACLTRVPRRVYVVRGLRLEGSSGPAAVILWAIERLTMALATDIVFVSESLSQEAERRHLLSPSKSWVIGKGSSNGVDAAAIQARVAQVDRDELRSSLGIDRDDFVVGYVGRVAADKGISTLLAATKLTQHPSLRLMIIGSTEDEELDREISSLGNVVRIPWTKDVWGHLPAMDILSLPTLREGFPNVVLEAAAAGLPAVTTRATGAVDSVVEGVTGLLTDVNDAHHMAKLFDELARDPERVREMGEAARLRVKEHFTPESIWLGLLEIISKAQTPQLAKRLSSTKTKEKV